MDHSGIAPFKIITLHIYFCLNINNYFIENDKASLQIYLQYI